MRAEAAAVLLALAAARAQASAPSYRPVPPVETTGTNYQLPLLPATTQPITVPLVVERFQAIDRDMKSLSCAFRQTVQWEESGTSQEVHGTLDYEKPEKLHIEEGPEAQTVVSDGQTLWIWRHSTDQVIETSLAEWKKSEPLAQGLLDFGRYADMLQRYDVTVSSVTPAPEDGPGQKRFSLLLTPKGKGKTSAEPADFSLRLRLSTRDYFPTKTELRVGGVSVSSTFSKIQYNPPIAASRFEFSPPPGADVFRNFKTQ